MDKIGPSYVLTNQVQHWLSNPESYTDDQKREYAKLPNSTDLQSTCVSKVPNILKSYFTQTWSTRQ